MIRIAVIGAGAMGAKHARIVTESSSAEVAVVIDSDATRAQQVAEQVGAGWSQSAESLDVDAVILATSTTSHAKLAAPVISAGIPILIEKPISGVVADVATLLDAAAQNDTVVMCGLAERWNPAIRTAFDLVQEPVVHFASVRHSPPAPRIETDVVVDLMIHDLDLACGVFQSDPSSVGANAWTPAGARVAEVADCTVAFAGGLATCSTSRLAQRKVRTVTLALETQMIEIDLIRQDVTVFRHVRHELTEAGTYRADTIMDIPIPRHHGEPLARQFRHFVDLITEKSDRAKERATLLRPHVLMDSVMSQAGML